MTTSFTSEPPVIAPANHGRLTEGFIAFPQRANAKDQAIMERPNPEDLPIDLSEEVHVRADLTFIICRQQLGRMSLGRSFTS